MFSLYFIKLPSLPFNTYAICSDLHNLSFIILFICVSFSRSVWLHFNQFYSSSQRAGFWLHWFLSNVFCSCFIDFCSDYFFSPSHFTFYLLSFFSFIKVKADALDLKSVCLKFFYISVWFYKTYLKFFVDLVAQSCLTLCSPVDCSTAGLPVLRHLLGLAQTHVHWVAGAIQPSRYLASPPPALILSSIRVFPMSQLFASGGLRIELQLQHQSSEASF